MERSAQSSFSWSNTLRMLSASTSPANRRLSWCTVSGSLVDRSAASSTRLTSPRSIAGSDPGSCAWGPTPVCASSSGGGAGFSCSFRSLVSCDRQRGSLGIELYVNGVERGLLSDLDHRLRRELEEGEEAHHQDRHAAFRLEELGEFHELAGREALQYAAHVRAHRELLARDAVMARHARAREEGAPRLGEVGHVHVGKLLGEGLPDVHLDQREVAAGDRHPGDRVRRLLHALV